MISAARAAVGAPGILTEVRSAPPLTIREVISEQDATCALCLVGSAAGPLPGDELSLTLDIAAGAAATLMATGATIAQGGAWPSARTAPARLQIAVRVGENGSLDADPGALIVCANARVEVVVSIELAESATLRWRETVVLGRSGEPAGAATIEWNVHRGGHPLLRQRIDLTDRGLTAWPGQLGEARMLRSELQVGPALDAVTVVHHPNEVTQKLAEHATLTTGLASRDGWRPAGRTGPPPARR